MENSTPQNYAYSWFLIPEHGSVTRVIHSDDDNDIDADPNSENSESLCSRWLLANKEKSDWFRFDVPLK
jgi:hypothetical protein